MGDNATGKTYCLSYAKNLVQINNLLALRLYGPCGMGVD